MIAFSTRWFAMLAIAMSALVAGCVSTPAAAPSPASRSASAQSAAVGPQTASEAGDLAQYRRYAGAPVDHVRYYQVQGFQYLAPDTVAIRFGVNQMYLLTVQTPCPNLAYANGIALTAKNHTLYSKFDFVTFDHQRCRIVQIVPVDELRMKQDRSASASGSSG